MWARTLFTILWQSFCYSQWGRSTWINAAVKTVISECCGFAGALIGTTRPNTRTVSHSVTPPNTQQCHSVHPRTLPRSANRAGWCCLASGACRIWVEKAQSGKFGRAVFVRSLVIWSLFVLGRLPRSHYAEKRTPVLMWLTGKSAGCCNQVSSSSSSSSSASSSSSSQSLPASPWYTLLESYGSWP